MAKPLRAHHGVDCAKLAEEMSWLPGGGTWRCAPTSKDVLDTLCWNHPRLHLLDRADTTLRLGSCQNAKVALRTRWHLAALICSSFLEAAAEDPTAEARQRPRWRHRRSTPSLGQRGPPAGAVSSSAVAVEEPEPRDNFSNLSSWIRNRSFAA